MLTDAHIERFSRQIVLPEVGGRGQARWLATTAAVIGQGPLVEVVALALAGAGIGHLILEASARELPNALADVWPEIDVRVADGGGIAMPCDVVVACEPAPDAVDRITAAMPHLLVAGGAHPAGGWMVAAASGSACAGCSVRAARAARGGSGHPALAGAAAGVIGSLMALAVLTRHLDPPRSASGGWLQFTLAPPAVTEHPVLAQPDCPRCNSSTRP